MDSSKIINLDPSNTPQEAMNAFAFNLSLLQGKYNPPVEGEQREDGSFAAFISADSKAAMFYADCQARNAVGRIVNDEIAFAQFDAFVLVTAKCYIYVDDVLRGTGVAGQVFQIGEKITMDRVVQFASGLAKSRALSNAGYGVISSVGIPGPAPMNPDPNGYPTNAELPFTMSEPTPTAAPVQTPAQNVIPVSQPMPGTIPVQQVSANEDPVMAARNVYWPKYRQTLGELLASNPGAIIWAAETMTQGGELKNAAKLLYPEACRLTGKPQKPLA